MLGLPSCKQVTELSSQLLDERLSVWTRLKLRAHLLMCDGCRRYRQQMQLTSATVGYWMQGKTMPEALKRQILEKLQSNTDGHQ
jgi:predicted anti-sigma-YlaC factor YlaD